MSRCGCCHETHGHRGRPRRSPSCGRRSRPRSGGEAEAGDRGRRALGHRHRAPREPADRQPAARPLGPPGRPGRSSFYLSLEDDLMRIFGSDRIDSMLQKLGLEEGEAIVHSWVNKAIEKAQKQGRGAQLRHPQEPAQVRRRDERPAQGDLSSSAATSWRRTTCRRRSGTCAIESSTTSWRATSRERAYSEQWDTRGAGSSEVQAVLGLEPCRSKSWADEEGIDDDVLRERLDEAGDGAFAKQRGA